MGTAAADHGYRAVLRVRDFRRVILALAVDVSGSWAYGVVLLVYVFNRTHSATWVGVTAVLRFLPGLLLSPYAGVIAEKYERTRVLVTSALTCAAVMGLITLLVVVHGPVALIVGLAVISAAAYTPYPPATGALVPQLVGEELLASANALQATVQNVTVIVGPAIGGLFLLMPSAAPAFAFNGATYVFAAACAGSVRARSVPTDVTSEGRGLWRQLSVGFRALGQAPRAAVPVGYAFLTTLVYGTDTVLFVPVSAHLHGGRGGYGYLLAAQAVGGIAATAAVTRAAPTRVTWWIWAGMVLYTVPSVAIPWLHAMPGGVAIQVVRGVGTLIVDVLALTALQRSVAPQLLARVLGLFSGLLFAASAAGSLLAPLLLHTVGFRVTVVALSIAVPAVATLGLPTLLRVDRDSAAEVERLRPIVALLGTLEPFAAATPNALEKLAAAAEPMRLLPGRAVVCEGEPADAFYVLEDGEVSVTSSGSGGAVIRTMRAPAFFGEIGLLHGIPRTATVTTTAPAGLLRISATAFEDALATTDARAGFYATAGMRLAATHPTSAPPSSATDPELAGGTG